MNQQQSFMYFDEPFLLVHKKNYDLNTVSSSSTTLQ